MFNISGSISAFLAVSKKILSGAFCNNDDSMMSFLDAFSENLQKSACSVKIKGYFRNKNKVYFLDCQQQHLLR